MRIHPGSQRLLWQSGQRAISTQMFGGSTSGLYGMGSASEIQRLAKMVHPKSVEWVDESELYKPYVPELVDDPRTGWSQKERRVGMLAQKVGMTRMWNEFLEAVPLTVLHVPECRVVQIKRDEATKPGYIALQIGAGPAAAKHLSKPLLGHYACAGTGPFRQLTEFRVTEDAVLPVGTELGVEHFVPGQLLDVQGTSKGKGYQGVMKRWNFGGGNATHGASLSHRSAGSTGSNQTPGRTWKGKKMAGQMGNETVTTKNLTLWAIDTRRSLLFVRGSVPGPKNGWLRVCDAKNSPFEMPPPFPTWNAARYGERHELPELVVAESRKPVWYVDLENRLSEARAKASSAGVKLEGLSTGLDEPAILKHVLSHHGSMPLLTRVLPMFYQPRLPTTFEPISDGDDHAFWKAFLEEVK